MAKFDLEGNLNGLGGKSNVVLEGNPIPYGESRRQNALIRQMIPPFPPLPSLITFSQKLQHLLSIEARPWRHPLHLATSQGPAVWRTNCASSVAPNVSFKPLGLIQIQVGGSWHSQTLNAKT